MRDPIEASETTPDLATPDPGIPDLTALQAMVRRLERGTGEATPAHGVAFGCPGVDAALPGEGLARGRVHEVVGETRSEVRDAAAFGFAIALLSRLAPDASTILWCARSANVLGGTPSARGLAALGLDPERVVFVDAEDEADRLWAMEEGLATAGLGAVVAEFDPARRPQATASRRLQLAAEKGGVSGIILRPRMTTPAGAGDRMPIAVETRWRVAAAPSSLASADLRPVWDVALERVRRGRPGRWTLAWQADGHRFEDLATTPANRTGSGRAAAPAESTAPAETPAAASEQAA